MPVGQRAGGGIGPIAKPGATSGARYGDSASQRIVSYKTSSALNPGDAVSIDVTGTSGNTVKIAPASAATPHLMLGIYTGEGGTNGNTARTGAIGMIAQANDWVKVCVSGSIDAWVAANAAAGAALATSATAGQLDDLSLTEDANGGFATFTLIEAPGASAAMAKVLVRSGL